MSRVAGQLWRCGHRRVEVGRVRSVWMVFGNCLAKWHLSAQACLILRTGRIRLI
jgi:hypothetical protein